MDGAFLVQELLGDLDGLPLRLSGFTHDPCDHYKLIPTFKETPLPCLIQELLTGLGFSCDCFQALRKHQTWIYVDKGFMAMLEV
ncbi:hypothetical protein PAL_GLEAN10020366 [Pteropus alecto]|uniref:Uncharacterized protein n=1 Tax=Pteropus alecto TaxID=9402 RepID=L5KH62_PTEAL|nr:hypothetical protein PAL_GLEAN10020366 [Pteropus alecto]